MGRCLADAEDGAGFREGEALYQFRPSATRSSGFTVIAPYRAAQ